MKENERMKRIKTVRVEENVSKKKHKIGWVKGDESKCERVFLKEVNVRRGTRLPDTTKLDSNKKLEEAIRKILEMRRNLKAIKSKMKREIESRIMEANSSSEVIEWKVQEYNMKMAEC